MQSDDLGLVAVAWRYRYKTDRTGDEWDDWITVDVDPNDWDWAPAWHDFEAQPLYDNAAIERLVAERDEALKAAEGLEPRIKHMRFEDGQFDMALTGQTVEAIAVAFVSHFKSLGAENYVELNMFDRAEPFQRYTVTVQKVGALSPADKVKAAEARRDKLKEALQAMVQRFELYLGPDNIHAGHHDLALVERARQALGDT